MEALEKQEANTGNKFNKEQNKLIELHELGEIAKKKSQSTLTNFAKSTNNKRLENEADLPNNENPNTKKKKK